MKSGRIQYSTWRAWLYRSKLKHLCTHINFTVMYMALEIYVWLCLWEDWISSYNSSPSYSSFSYSCFLSCQRFWLTSCVYSSFRKIHHLTVNFQELNSFNILTSMYYSSFKVVFIPISFSLWSFNVWSHWSDWKLSHWHFWHVGMIEEGDVEACCFMEEGVKLLIQINLFF